MLPDALSSRTWLQAHLFRFWGLLRLVWRPLALIFPRRLRPINDKDELHPTAYLDALRGYAAWIVFNYHMFHAEWQPQKLPYRFFFRGIAMVDLFFVISGFALSYSILGAVHRGGGGGTSSSDKVLGSLAASMFRRYIRLYLPMVFASFVTMLVGVAGLGVPMYVAPDLIKPTLAANLRFWVQDTAKMCDPFAHVYGWLAGGPTPAYLGPLWTIPVEYRGSMLVFVFCAMTCKMTPWARTAMLWIGMAASCWWQAPYASLFLGGMWLADRRQWLAAQQRSVATTVLPTTTTEARPFLTLLQEAETEIVDDKYADSERTSCEVSIDEPKHNPRPSFWRRLVFTHRLSRGTSYRLLQQSPWITLFFFSLFILAGPAESTATSPFPFNLIYHTMPPNLQYGNRVHWHRSIGAMMTMCALEQSPLLRKPFEARFSQYLGELSFGIYAMHITVGAMVWEQYFIKWQIAYWGDDAGRFIAFFPGYCVLTVLVLWAAEGFRLVDMRCVLFSKWVKDKVFVRE